MGYGTWTKASYSSYATERGLEVDSLTGIVTTAFSNQDYFKAKTVDPILDPKHAIRECCDSAEHPNTRPVILALDVTGSMGQSAVEVAKKLNVIMTDLYKKVTDVQFMVMGIGDLAYDYAPIQASQFESDIRIAEQLDKVYFEFGGGGNYYESYTVAWYFGARHTKLDCWNRGKKGIIITMGDEMLNPYLPKAGLNRVTGDTVQSDVETKALFEEVSEKYDVYHLNVVHRKYGISADHIEKSFMEYLDDKHYRNVNLDNIADAIVEIIVENDSTSSTVNNTEISW